MREKNHSTLGRWQKTQYECKLYTVELWKYIRAMKTALTPSSQCAQLKDLYLYGFVTICQSCRDCRFAADHHRLFMNMKKNDILKKVCAFCLLDAFWMWIWHNRSFMSNPTPAPYCYRTQKIKWMHKYNSESLTNAPI